MSPEHYSKAVRNTAWKAIEADPRMPKSMELPFDGKRVIYGGFVPLLIEGKTA